MSYSAVIKVKQNPDIVFKAFQAEAKNLKTERSEYTIKKLKHCVEFHINAQDSVALRATLNSITKLFTVYEKIDSINKK
ncbi:MAG: KEOPS complex subunit Pcc1 [Candidatus Nanoarchaeia archaeon]|nr:KEOPS complex subunit Pcc1 [Candidatus Nanoarchaeia archaeon]